MQGHRTGEVAGLRPAGMGWPSATPSRTVFEVHNGKTKLWHCPPALQQAIYAVAAYPTETAKSVSQGWRPPEADFGEKHWDGWVRLSTWGAGGMGSIPTGLLDLALAQAQALQIPVQVCDARKRPEEGVPDFPALPLRDYQIEACDRACAAGRGVLDMPPRAGKTRCGVEIIRRIWRKAVWIAPTTNIVEQTARVFTELCGRYFAAQIVGTKSWPTHDEKVHIMTAATAAMLPEEYFQTREVLLIDEFHHGASPQYHDIAGKCDHIYFRYGMTGTFGRSGDDEVALHALLSNRVFQITTPELVQRGYLVPSSAAFLPVDAPKLKGVSHAAWMAGLGKKGIAAHEYRNALAAWAAATLSAKGRKVLVLVATKEQGNTIRDACLDYLGAPLPSEFKPVEFVSTEKDTPLNRRIIDAFSNTDEIKVLVGTSMVGEGTDLPSADALVYAMGGKAEISHRQAMFRVCTAMPGKRRAIVVDFADRHADTLMKHSLERANTYCTEASTEVHALRTVEEFSRWVDWVTSSGVLHR